MRKPSKLPQHSADAGAELENAQAIECALSAVNIAALGMSSVDNLRAILKAIHKLSIHDEATCGLARIGVFIADDYHNMLDCEREDAGEKLAALKGVDHA